MTDFLAAVHPVLAERLQKHTLADLPTPVSTVSFDTVKGARSIIVKHDDVTSPIYGGNKIRKLEYILHRAEEHGARRIATFGTVGSNHALATAIFANRLGFECTCFLGHQRRSASIPKTLNMHRQLDTELVRIGGSVDRLATLRHYLHGRRSWVVPLGGSSWLGAVGFVNAGLELASQITAGDLDVPDRVYIAAGTMGSTAGLALGLALAELPTELHAVRVVDASIGNPHLFDRLMRKTAMMMRRLDSSIPADLVERTRLCWRDDFFAGGYAVSDKSTAAAVTRAKDDLSLSLETTYTGKAMTALLHDLESPEYSGENCLFWNTYNSRPLPVTATKPVDAKNIPVDFMSYFD